MAEVRRPGPPPPPERRHSPPDSKEFKDKLKEVEKISEVDPELKKKKRLYREAGEEESVKEDERLTPYEALFGKGRKESDIFGRNVSEEQQNIEKDYGSPTRSNVASPSFTREKDSNELPTSHQFWGQSTQGPKETKPEDEKKEKDSGQVVPEKKKTGYAAPIQMGQEEEKEIEEPSPFSTLTKKEKEELEKLEKDGKAKEGATIAGAPEKEKKEALDAKEMEKIAKKEVDEKAKAPSVLREKKKKEEEIQKKYGSLEGLAKNFSPITFLPEKKEDGKTIPVPSTPQPITPEVVSQAVGATTRAAPYLTPGVQDLFTQMVSTIIVMQAQGVTTTQVTLSSPAFINTAFDGATITLRQYATAPDSFNITLSGSNQAVSLFNENLPALQRAFEQSKLPFKVGRLEAEYGEAKPLIRRKKGAREKGDR